jgi:hypothetical protein
VELWWFLVVMVVKGGGESLLGWWKVSYKRGKNREKIIMKFMIFLCICEND